MPRRRDRSRWPRGTAAVCACRSSRWPCGGTPPVSRRHTAGWTSDLLLVNRVVGGVLIGLVAALLAAPAGGRGVFAHLDGEVVPLASTHGVCSLDERLRVVALCRSEEHTSELQSLRQL